MSLWQKTMIELARSSTLKRIIQGAPFAGSMARRFVGGDNAAEAICTAADLKGRKVSCSFFYLGEYVEDSDLIERSVQEIIALIEQLARSGPELHVSVDPTQVGYSISEELGRSNAIRIGKVLAEHKERGRVFMMLDMEDMSFVRKTVDLHAVLQNLGVPVAITLQAYLLRSEEDVREMISRGSAVRLVKGAFVGDRSYAFVHRKDIDGNYMKLAEMLLSREARQRGVYPIFGTHDDRIIGRIRRMAREKGWSPNGFEFEMLYGVRPWLQKEITKEGCSLRLYLPFGTDWWPYTIRRVGENPANLRFILSSILCK